MTRIHPTAIIEPGARISADAEIGPYCVVGADVTFEAGVRLHSHVVVAGRTNVGEGTRIYPFASIGHPPQDLKYKGEPSTLTIGKHNVIREHVTMNPGTEGGGMQTTVGDHCLFMVATHVAHDCHIGNHVILANNATLGGHVTVGDYAIIGGLAAIHQFVRIGHQAIIGGMSGVEHDVIPYGSVIGERASLAGLNLVGLKRRGFDRDTIHALRHTYKILFDRDDGTLQDRMEALPPEYAHHQPVSEMLAFMAEKGSRSLCTPKMRGLVPDDEA